MKTITLQDISNELKISKATISNVLNGRGDEKRISKETQEKIKKFAHEHKYKANRLARALSSGKSDLIGLIVPNISDVFFATIARRIEKRAVQGGYDVIFSSTGESVEREKKIIQSMLERKVDGLIIASCQKNEEDILQLIQNNFPLVLVDRRYPDIKANFVGLDNYEGISILVKQLVSLGRKRIGFITLNIALINLRERLDSYLRTMELSGIDVENGFVQELDYDHTESDLQRILDKMLKHPIHVDSLVFATHFDAADAIRQLKAMKVNVPEDVALVSFGQKKDFDIIEPPITAVKFPIDIIGDRAVDILLKNIKNSNSILTEEYFQTELIIRKSCGAKW